MKIRLITVTLAFLALGQMFAQVERCAVIPLPQYQEERAGVFVLKKGTAIKADKHIPDITSVIEQFNERLSRVFGFECRQTTGKGSIVLKQDHTMPEEAYKLQVDSDNIIIRASATSGFRYAFVTLTQLLPQVFLGDKASTVSPAIPCVYIEDYPRFAYRGFHLDVARHFVEADNVKKLIDAAALFKLNHFHWHLTDDQGWRIEIKKYPLLTQTGSVRSETMIGTWDNYSPVRYDGKPYGGYYTQKEIREIVRYAQERGVTIIPEIDVPGHASAAIAAYPELACNRTKEHQVATKWGIFEDVLCTRPFTWEFLDHVLAELADLFPGEYIHLGGDECPKAAWSRCPDCQQLIKKVGVKDENALQGYFMQQCEKIAKKYGKRMIGWDEIADEELPQDAIVMAWRGSGQGAVAAINKQHEVIMTPSEYLYFDYNQEDPENAPLSIGGLIDLQKVYSYDPVPDSLAGRSEYIKGVQANTWTEYISGFGQVQYMMFPRLIALSEIAWTNREKKDWNNFAVRLNEMFGRLESMKINVCRNYYEPTFYSSWNAGQGKTEISIRVMYPEASVYYTIDGTEPTMNSRKYTEPIFLSEGTRIKARSYSKDGGALSKTITKMYVVSKATGRKYVASYEGNSMDWYHVGREVINDGKYGIVPDNGGWLVFGRDSVVLTFDLDRVEDVSQLVIGCTCSPMNNVLGISKVLCSFSEDGVRFANEVASKFEYPSFSGVKEIHRQKIDFKKQQARYVRIVLTGTNSKPADYPYPDALPGFAVDEIEIY